MTLTADIQVNELENQTFHLTPEQREAALLQVYQRPMQEYRLRLKRPKSVFCNRFISSKLWKRGLEITQFYRTFLMERGSRGFLSIELGYAKETVSLLLSKLANPEL